LNAATGDMSLKGEGLIGFPECDLNVWQKDTKLHEYFVVLVINQWGRAPPINDPLPSTPPISVFINGHWRRQVFAILQLLCFWTLAIVLFLFKTHNVSETVSFSVFRWNLLS
jgi:hypothetical protein